MADEGFGDLGNLADVFTGGDMPTGMDWMSNFNFGDLGGGGWGGNWWDQLGGGLDALNFNFGGGGGGNFNDIMKGVGSVANIGKTGFDVYNSIERQKQMADYNKAVQDYYKKQGDYVTQQQAYLKAKQEWEQNYMDQFGGALGEFDAAKGEFQGQIEAASAKANDVMGQYLAAAKPLLAQSQDLLVPGVAALARGETPEQWQPILNEARLRGTTAMVQSMVSAGMSPEEAHAAAQPVAEQQAQTMLLQLATSMVTQGGQLGQIGMAGLQGAGGLTQIMGQLAAMGMQPETQEFQIMASVLGSILGSGVPGTTMQPPPPPTA